MLLKLLKFLFQSLLSLIKLINIKDPLLITCASAILLSLEPWRLDLLDSLEGLHLSLNLIQRVLMHLHQLLLHDLLHLII